MAKSRRLERSTNSFSYSSYHTLEEVGLPGQALGSVAPLGTWDLQTHAETSQGLWSLWDCELRLGEYRTDSGGRSVGGQSASKRSRSQDSDRGDCSSIVQPMACREPEYRVC